MRFPISFIGARDHARRIILRVIATLVVIPLYTPLAKDILAPTPPTMADVLFFMDKYRQFPEYVQVKMTEFDLHNKFKTYEVPAQFAALRNKWIGIIGENNWGYFHHYSRGVLRLHEGLSIVGISEEEITRKKYHLDGALEEFMFIENSATDNSFPLWPQLYMYEYQIYSRLGQPDMALKALQRAQKLQKKSKSSP